MTYITTSNGKNVKEKIFGGLALKKNIHLVLLICGFIALFISGCAKDEAPIAQNNNEKNNNEKNNIDQIIEKMSLDDKLGQMIFAGITGTTLTQETKNLIHVQKVGGIIFYANNLQSSSQTLSLLNAIKKENSNNLIPLFLGIDQEGGLVSRLPKEVTKLPQNSRIGEINNADLSNEIGSNLGEQLRAFGFNLNFAPVLDVNSNPNNTVIGDRSFSSDPNIVSNLGIATMKGIQSQQVIPVIKHFPGHGDTSVDSHLELPLVNNSLMDLKKIELVPFREAIDNGANVVMIAHIVLPKIDTTKPASMSKPIITDLLRKEMGFDGVVITDDMTMGAITDHFEIGQAAVESIKAGSDIIMVAHNYDYIITTVTAIKEAINKGELTEERINESVKRIISLKLNYKLSNESIKQIDLYKLNQSIDTLLKKINR